MVWLLLGVVLGLLIGAGLVYWTLQSKIEQQSQELQRSRNAFEELEKSRESRIQAATQALLTDYQNQLAQETDTLKAEHAAEVQALKQDYEARLGEVNSAAATPTESAPPAQIPPSPESMGTDPAPGPFASTAEAKIAEFKVAEAKMGAGATSEKPSLSTQRQSEPPTAFSKLAQSVHSTDRNSRRQAAVALGQMVATQGLRAEAQTLPILTKLVRDPDPSVRQSAIAALGNIPSEKVIPLLKQALRDPNGEVVRSAHQTMGKFKFYRTKPAIKPQKPQAKKAK